jgi:hypothetical protein
MGPCTWHLYGNPVHFRNAAGKGFTIVIPYAFIDSDNIDFGAKGVIDETLHNGVVYARYKKLDLVVKISDGKKYIDLIRAKAKFDEYRPPK